MIVKNTMFVMNVSSDTFMHPNIIYEDNHIIAVEKDPGIPTQGDITGIKSLLDLTRDYIRDKYRKPGNVFLGMVHRLDKPVSGLVVFARTSKAASRLTVQFQKRSVIKMYLAVVDNPAAVAKDGWIGIEQSIRRHRGYSVITGEDDSRADDARLAYHHVISDDRYALLLVHLFTGRKHQIRAQLSSLGMPVAGDTIYGSGTHNTDKSIALHSFYICFNHPTRSVPVSLRTAIPVRFYSIMAINDSTKELIDTIISRSLGVTGTNNINTT